MIDKSLCSVTELVCPSNRPIRCHDGNCYGFPSHGITGLASYAYGYQETEQTIARECLDPSVFNSTTGYLTIGDYNSLLQDCVGDLGKVSDGGTTLTIDGDIWFDSQLLAIGLDIVIGGGIFIYHGQTYQIPPDGSGPTIIVLTETYEQRDNELLAFTNITTTVRLTTENWFGSSVVDLRPAPFIYNSRELYPSEWSTIYINNVNAFTTVIYQLNTLRSRIEIGVSDGNYFLATILNSTTSILIPSGAIVPLSMCTDVSGLPIQNCIWSTIGSISYDGTKKLCVGMIVSSSSSLCTPMSYSGFPLVITVVTCSVTGTTVPYNGGGWVISESDTERPQDDSDFTFDGSWLTVTDGPLVVNSIW